MGIKINKIKVLCHPLLLLHVVDHINRNKTKNRVLGIILGIKLKNKNIEALTAFGFPFEEDLKSNIYYIDRDYIKEMYGMLKRINALEIIVGWYHSGGKLKKNDLNIHNSFRNYISTPILFLFYCDKGYNELPIKAYI